mgnify:CR=1 FL=1
MQRALLLLLPLLLHLLPVQTLPLAKPTGVKVVKK